MPRLFPWLSLARTIHNLASVASSNGNLTVEVMLPLRLRLLPLLFIVVTKPINKAKWPTSKNSYYAAAGK